LDDYRSELFTLVEMKETHVFLLDEAQKLIEAHYDIKAILFRGIWTWLRWKRPKTTVMADFSGTFSAILKHTIPTDLVTHDRLVPDSSSHDERLGIFFIPED
jgi:hypothetical protein